jgi:transcription elongation GreA/GreB family factor
MSRAFVKDSDDIPDHIAERPVSPHPNLVTAEGLALIEAELARLHQEQAKATDRTASAKIARDLRYWVSRRSSAQVVAVPSHHARVHFGSTVTIRRDDGRSQTFRIVGEDEAEPARGTIAYVSPVARALMGREVGEVVRAGPTDAEIVDIA